MKQERHDLGQLRMQDMIILQWIRKQLDAGVDTGMKGFCMQIG